MIVNDCKHSKSPFGRRILLAFILGVDRLCCTTKIVISSFLTLETSPRFFLAFKSDSDTSNGTEL